MDHLRLSSELDSGANQRPRHPHLLLVELREIVLGASFGQSDLRSLTPKSFASGTPAVFGGPTNNRFLTLQVRGGMLPEIPSLHPISQLALLQPESEELGGLEPRFVGIEVWGPHHCLTLPGYLQEFLQPLMELGGGNNI